MMGMIALSFPSCTGILSGLYDEVGEGSRSRFVEFNPEQGTGTVFVDATDITQWTYINFDFHTLELNDIDVEAAGKDPEYDNAEYMKPWHIAMHKWDIRTNGAEAMETEFSEISDLVASGKIPEGEFTADEMAEVIVDMSQMMDGIIVSVPSPVNKVAGKWLDVDTSEMPPIYTESNKVYLIRFQEGDLLALRFRDYVDDTYVKGNITFDYMYPVKF